MSRLSPILPVFAAAVLTPLWTAASEITGAARSEAEPADESTQCQVPSIELWYGDRQRFGEKGNPQPLINLLGQVTPPDAVADASFSVNGGPVQPLYLGVDLYRLSRPGAFNAEIERRKLKAGENSVVIRARTQSGHDSIKKVTILYTPSRKWSLPYRVQWSSIEHIQEAVEVVDGKWRLTSEGVRTLDPYYDRVLAMGDSSWRDYEALVDVTYHKVLADPGIRNTDGPPYLDHAHASVVLRWAGHFEDNWRPRRDWRNLGVIAMLRSDLGRPKKASRWWLHLGNPASVDPKLWGDDWGVIEPERTYRYRVRVESFGDSHQAARYSAKAWPRNEDEPSDWDVVFVEPNEPVKSGALLLVSHHSDVTFGDILVRPIDQDVSTATSDARLTQPDKGS